jgi:hypothetical protein
MNIHKSDFRTLVKPLVVFYSQGFIKAVIYTYTEIVAG